MGTVSSIVRSGWFRRVDRERRPPCPWADLGDRSPTCDDDPSLTEGAKLPYVSGPVKARDALHGLRCHRRSLDAVLAGGILQEVACQQRDVFWALSERGR